MQWWVYSSVYNTGSPKRINTCTPERVSELLLLLSFLLLLHLLLAEQRIIKTLVGKDPGNGFVQAPFQRITITTLVLSNWAVKIWTNGGIKHGKVYRKTVGLKGWVLETVCYWGFNFDYKFKLWVSKVYRTRFHRPVTLFACAASASPLSPSILIDGFGD